MKSLFTFFTLFSVIGLINAAPAPKGAPKAVTYPHRRPHMERPHRPNFQPGQQVKPGNNNGYWRVFSQLTPAEQKEMMQLQRTEPEKFRTVMQEKLEKIEEKDEKLKNYEKKVKLKPIITTFVPEFKIYRKTNEKHNKQNANKCSHFLRKLSKPLIIKRGGNRVCFCGSGRGYNALFYKQMFAFNKKSI